MTKRTLTPISRAASAFSTTASMALPNAGTGGDEVQCQRDHEADDRDQELEVIDPGAEQVDRLLRQEGREAARFLAKGEEDDIVDDDAAGDRRHQPGIGTALREGAPACVRSPARRRRTTRRGGDRQRHRPSERDRESVAEHGPQHERRALREVDRVGDHIGDVKSERDQPVHAAEAETGNDGGRDEHGVPIRSIRARAKRVGPSAGPMTVSLANRKCPATALARAAGIPGLRRTIRAARALG